MKLRTDLGQSAAKYQWGSNRNAMNGGTSARVGDPRL